MKKCFSNFTSTPWFKNHVQHHPATSWIGDIRYWWCLFGSSY